MYRTANADRLKKEKHDYYIKNKDEINAKKAIYREERREITNQKARVYYEKNKERIRLYQIINRVRYWATQTRNAHKSRGYNVLISTDDLHAYAETVETCYWCGLKIDWIPKPGKVSACLPALDRVNNGKVLDHIWTGPEDKSEGAVMITCHKCGTTKQNRTHDEFLEYCRKVVRIHQ